MSSCLHPHSYAQGQPPPPRGVVAASRHAEAPPLQRLAPSPTPTASGGGGIPVWVWLQSRGCWRRSASVAAHEAALPPCPPSRLRRAGGIKGGDTPLSWLAGAAAAWLFSRKAPHLAAPAIKVAPLSPRGLCVVGAWSVCGRLSVCPPQSIAGVSLTLAAIDLPQFVPISTPLQLNSDTTPTIFFRQFQKSSYLCTDLLTTKHTSIMGKVPNGFMSGFIGKVGGVVGYKNRYGFLLRTKSTPKNPQTPGQMTQRNSIALLSFLCANIIDTIEMNCGYPWHREGFSAGLFPRPLFMKRNYAAGAIEGHEYDNLSIDYSAVIAAPRSGRFVPNVVQRGSLLNEDANTIHVAWDDNSSASGAASGDNVRVICICPEVMGDGESCIVIGSASRSEVGTDVVCPSSWHNKKVHVYVDCVSITSDYPDADSPKERMYGYPSSGAAYWGNLTLAV